MKIAVRKNYYIATVVINLAIIFLLGSCACLSAEQNAAAQATINTHASNRKPAEKDFEFLNLVGDPCRFSGASGGNVPGWNQFYELQNAGYPKPVSLDEATAVFNRIAQCNEIGKAQPPLRPEEVLDSIARWNCEGEIKDPRSKPFDKESCREINGILKTVKLPKGSWIEGDGRTCGNCDGYEVKAWEIQIVIKLDRHRRDLKGQPIFARQIRMNYISANPSRQE